MLTPKILIGLYMAEFAARIDFNFPMQLRDSSLTEEFAHTCSNEPHYIDLARKFRAIES